MNNVIDKLDKVLPKLEGYTLVDEETDPSVNYHGVIACYDHRSESFPKNPQVGQCHVTLAGFLYKYIGIASNGSDAWHCIALINENEDESDLLNPFTISFI